MNEQKEKIQSDKLEGEAENQSLEPKKQKKSLRVSVIEWAESLTISVIIIAVLTTFPVRLVGVSGNSMLPTYHHGDRLITTRVGENFETGDVVVLVDVLEEPIIKRIVATEGQVVDFDPNIKEVTVDGVPLYGEVFGIENGITEVPDFPGEVLDFPQTVPEDCVFVLGDNRGNSKDSRFIEVGIVDERNILGKAILNLYPFSLVDTGDF